MKYTEVKDGQPEMVECFWAFNKAQFKEKEKEFEGKKIYRSAEANGLFGTKEGLKKFWAFYNDQQKQIAENCDPQEVYDYEFGNHECNYTRNDEEAIKIVASYFGDDKAKKVKRRFGYIDIEDLQYF